MNVCHTNLIMEILPWAPAMGIPGWTKLPYYSALSRNYTAHWRYTGYLTLLTRSGWQLYTNVLIKTNGSLRKHYNKHLLKIASSFIMWGSWEKISDRLPPWWESWEPLGWELQPFPSCFTSRGCLGLAREFSKRWMTHWSLMPVKLPITGKDWKNICSIASF